MSKTNLLGFILWCFALESSATEANLIKLLVAPGSWYSGKTQIEALLVDQDIHEVEFLLDGESADRVRRPPWRTQLQFDEGSEHSIEVIAYGSGGRELDRDAVIVNRRPIPFRVQFTSLQLTDDSATVEFEVAVSIPHDQQLEEVAVSFRDQPPVTLPGPPFRSSFSLPRLAADDYLEATAQLTNGARTETVRLLSAVGITETIDVNVVQLQVLATTRNGRPVTSLTADDFAVFQGKEQQRIDSFAIAPEVPLMLGLVLDSSGSMEPMWPRTMAAAQTFLDQTMGDRDRTFLVDFADTVRLVSPPTNDRASLETALASIKPKGGTALFDSIAFSLLQFGRQPGRRALVVITDGFDSGSTIDKNRTVELATALGVPVYVVALPSQALQSRDHTVAAASIVHLLKLMTDPTGGRLLRLGGGGGIARAFGQISDELRRQYILTYSTDQLPGGKQEKVEVTIPARKKEVEVRAVLPLDQIQ